MSERERWIVYPILFLTLGIALRDKIFQRVNTDNMVARRVFSEQSASNRFWADEIYCRKLSVAQQAEIGGVAWPPGDQRHRYSGVLRVNDHHAQPAVVAQLDPNAAAGRVSTYADGKELVTLGASESGGLIGIAQRDHRYTMDIGHLSVTGIFIRAGKELLDWHLLYDPDQPAANGAVPLPKPDRPGDEP